MKHLKPVFYNSKGKHKTRVSGVKTKACQLWENIKLRCTVLPQHNESKFGKYSSVTIEASWLDFQEFAEWFLSVDFHEGWTLDKDLLGYNHYGPDSCIFLPDEVNKALSLKPRVRGDLPIGVSRNTQNPEMVDIQYSCKNSQFAFRKYTQLSNMKSVWLTGYKAAREGYLKYLADKYRLYLDIRAYNALYSYTVSLED